jgi:hypothetical protein
MMANVPHKLPLTFNGLHDVRCQNTHLEITNSASQPDGKQNGTDLDVDGDTGWGSCLCVALFGLPPGRYDRCDVISYGMLSLCAIV